MNKRMCFLFHVFCINFMYCVIKIIDQIKVNGRSNLIVNNQLLYKGSLICIEYGTRSAVPNSFSLATQFYNFQALAISPNNTGSK